MSYQEREVPRESLEKLLRNLDSDEGIRMDVDGYHIFINKTSKRYCIDISRDGTDEFVYKSSVDEVIDLLSSKADDTAKFFSY